MREENSIVARIASRSAEQVEMRLFFRLPISDFRLPGAALAFGERVTAYLLYYGSAT